jgi:hypothetical protein
VETAIPMPEEVVESESFSSARLLWSGMTGEVLGLGHLGKASKKLKPPSEEVEGSSWRVQDSGMSSRACRESQLR